MTLERPVSLDFHQSIVLVPEATIHHINLALSQGLSSVFSKTVDCLHSRNSKINFNEALKILVTAHSPMSCHRPCPLPRPLQKVAPHHLSHRSSPTRILVGVRQAHLYPHLTLFWAGWEGPPGSRVSDFLWQLTPSTACAWSNIVGRP